MVVGRLRQPAWKPLPPPSPATYATFFLAPTSGMGTADFSIDIIFQAFTVASIAGEIC
jgi:hypothetical protein